MRLTTSTPPLSAEVQENSVERRHQMRSTRPPTRPGSLEPSLLLSQEKAALVQANAMALKTLRQGLAYPYQNPPIRSFSPSCPIMPFSEDWPGCSSWKGRSGRAGAIGAGPSNSNLDAVEIGEKIPHGGALIGNAGRGRL